MKLLMLTISHDVYGTGATVPDGWDVLKVTYQNGYWKLLLGEHQETLDEWLNNDH